MLLYTHPSRVDNMNDSVSAIEHRIIDTRKKLCLSHFIISLLLLLFIDLLALDTNGILFYVYSLWAILVYALLVFSELRYPGLNIMVVFFVGAIMSLAFPSIQSANALIDGKSICCDEDYNVVTGFVFRTAVAMNIYYGLFILALTHFSRGRLYVIDIHYIVNRFNLFWVSVFLYFIATVLRVIPFLELISSTLALFARNIPMLVLLLLAVYCGTQTKRDKYYRLFIILILVEVFYNMFFGFYKADVMKPVALYMVYYYLHCRVNNIKLLSFNTFFAAAFFMVFLLLIVYPFMEIKRSESNFTLQEDVTSFYKVDNVDILKRVLTGNYELRSDNDSDNAFSSRMSALSTNAFFYQDAYKNGYHQDLLIASVQKMVPRFLWKNKLNRSPGQMAKNYLLMKSFDSDAGSSAYVGLFAGSYFWGGWVAVIFMCFINALFISLLLRVCFSNLDNLFSWLFLFFLIFSMLRCFEEICDGGYELCVMYTIYSLIILASSKFFIKGVRRGNNY